MLLNLSYIILATTMDFFHTFFLLRSRMGDVEDFPDMRVDGASPGPRVTFNIQDTVKYMHFLSIIGYPFSVAEVPLNFLGKSTFLALIVYFFFVYINIISPSISIC